jgi:hypothetical protein
MEMWKKISIGAGAGGILIGGILFIPKLLKLKSASVSLDVVPRALLHKIDFTGVTIRIDVQLKNPTSAVFKMKYPYVHLSYKGSTIGTSQSINQDIGMVGFGEANINGIIFHIPMISLLSVLGGLLKGIQNNEEIKLDITTMTHIDPYWKYDEDKKEWSRLPNLGKKSTIPYPNNKTITLNKQAEEG